MKLASLRSGRDGRLLVVSRDLRRAVLVTHFAATMQQAIDDWAQVAPRLQEDYEQLQAGRCPEAFDLDVMALATPFHVPMGCTAEQARGHIKLVMLLNDYTLRALTPYRAAQGLRVPAGQADERVLAGRGDVGRTDRPLGW